jgi:hypothetical protein
MGYEAPKQPESIDIFSPQFLSRLQNDYQAQLREGLDPSIEGTLQPQHLRRGPAPGEIKVFESGQFDPERPVLVDTNTGVVIERSLGIEGTAHIKGCVSCTIVGSRFKGVVHLTPSSYKAEEIGGRVYDPLARTAEYIHHVFREVGEDTAGCKAVLMNTHGHDTPKGRFGVDAQREDLERLADVLAAQGFDRTQIRVAANMPLDYAATLHSEEHPDSILVAGAPFTGFNESGMAQFDEHGPPALYKVPFDPGQPIETLSPDAS